VAIPDRVEAVEALQNLFDATLTVDSKASPEYLDQFDLRDGQILSSRSNDGRTRDFVRK
jgi:hypothetical protein